MTATVTKIDASTANVVDGFSDRFQLLMDRAGMPRHNRISIGSRRFSVVHNTFKNWCEKNKIPGKHAMLVQITEALLSDVPGRFDTQAVVAWLLTGDAVPNPFRDDTDALGVVELYFQISDVAKREGVEFDSLPRDIRNLILRRVKTWLDRTADPVSGPVLELDDSTTNMVLGMIEAAQSRPDR